MEKLEANKILQVITSNMYYNELGELNEQIDNIMYNTDYAIIKLKDGRGFTIKITIK